jgi:hypothetical protein
MQTQLMYTELTTSPFIDSARKENESENKKKQIVLNKKEGRV